MKSRIRAAVVLLAIVCALAVIACSGNPSEPSSDAKLTGLTIGGVKAAIPQVISRDDWESIGVSYDLSEDADFKLVEFSSEDQITETRIQPSYSSGARVEWGIGNRSTRPDSFGDYRRAVTFANNDFLYFKVTSSDGLKQNYYRFYARITSPVNELFSVTLSGRDADIIATPGDTPANARTGTVNITTIESQSVTVEVVRFDDNAGLRYAIAGSSDEPVFGTNNTFRITDNQILHIEVTAENGSKNFYKFRIYVGRIATIKTLKVIDRNNEEVEILGKGTEAAAWTSITAPGSFETADQPNDGFSILLELDDPAGTATYGKTASAVPNFTPAPAKFRFDNGEYLGIKIVPENSTAANVTRYYKIKINLLAANITVQPASAVYYVDIVTQNMDTNRISEVTPTGGQTVTPLSVTLDRAGTYTYQWYEANSWYGGYGFDADGRIVTGKDTSGAWIAETGFVEGDYYVKGFDEKNNVVFHNGGNQYYRLVVPGRAIPDATGATFTPYSTEDVNPDHGPINHSPFIGCATKTGGYTNETHYYWVVVTDSNGLTVTSKRAAIVSETVPTKKHYIVDLNDLRDEDNNLVPARNPVAFAKIYDGWTMPLKFPIGFDIMDYTVCIAQARFYLKDGTPWIQNWTQGNLSFDLNGESQVLFYNLTNNNAAYGLDGDSKVPLGANLEVIPTEVTTYVSGEKSPKYRPPFEADGVTPINNNDAQGVFCHYIELVELHFEGPRRVR